MSGSNTTELRRKDDPTMKDLQTQQEKILQILQDQSSQLQKLVIGMYGIPENKQKGLMEIVQDHEKRIDAQEQKTHDFPFKQFRDIWTSGKTFLAILTALQISLTAVIALIIEKGSAGR